MKKIIQEWLTEKLGIVIDLQKIDFQKKVMDGYLVGQVLQGFEVISKEELSFIKPTSDKNLALDYFMNHILIWLGRLDIRLNDADVEDILNAQGNAGMNLFYEMYLALQDKSKLHFIAQKRALEKCRKEIPKYRVENIKESILDDFDLEASPYCHPLVENRDIIKWHKDRLALLKKQCEAARKEYSRYYDAKKIEDPPALVCTCQLKCICPKQKIKDEIDYPDQASQNFTYEELIQEYTKSTKIKPHTPNFDEAKVMVNQLKKKRQEIEEKELQKTKLHTELCEEFWHNTLNKQQQKVSEMLDEKILAQSHYEKQMMNKIYQVKHQQEVIKEKRQFINDEIMKLKEEDVLHKLYIEQKVSDECVCDFLYERERIKQLHKRIYAEKQRLKKMRIEKICRDTAEDLVNLAIMVGEYKEEYQKEPGRRRFDDWVSLFLRCGSILPKLVPTENVVKDLDDVAEEEREALIEEIERQEIMDAKDFDKYNRCEWPWESTNVSATKLDFSVMERGMNVIGYVVHRLLFLKYPETALMPKPDFKFEYNVCVNGLTDSSVVGKLQSLLIYKDIAVFEINDALNHCLNKFKKEHKPEEGDDIQSDEEESKAAKKHKRVQTKVRKGKKGKQAHSTHSNKSEASAAGNINVFAKEAHLNKKHQTPKVFPGEEVKMSHAAQLGEIAQNSLDQGEPLTEYLLAAMIIEYLHTVKEKKGWALVNYPNNFNQAVTLEENLSSTPLAKDLSAIKSIMDLADLDDNKHGDEIIHKEKDTRRYSKIFPLPPKMKEDDAYTTFLTSYIKIIKSTSEEAGNIEDSVSPVTRYLEDSADPLEKFYADQGCCYFLYYETFDHETVKFLARLIIGDFSLPRKPSIELFGKSVLLGQDEDQEEGASLNLAKASKEISGKEKPKKKLIVSNITEESVHTKIKKDKKKKGKGKKSKKQRSLNDLDDDGYENKYVQVPSLEDIYEIIVEEDDPNILPGDEKWKFIDMPMPEEMLLILAKMCENMESLYIEDFKQVLFMRRMLLNTIQPFISHTKAHLLQFIQRPDDRQDILHEFQMTFNSFSECLRSDDEVKAELYCRAEELRAALVSTSETNIMESFNERDRVIEEHWLRKQLHELVQVYYCAMQLELDRFVDTLQLLTDYYVTGITNMPSEEAPLQKEMLRSTESDNVNALSVAKHWENAFDIKFFNERLADKMNKSFDFIEKTKNAAMRATTATQGKFALGKPKPDKQKGGKGAPSIQMSDVVRDNMDKLIEEWKAAIEGEVERVHFRLKLLKRDSEIRLRDMSNKVRDMMIDLYGVIRKRLNNELSSINNLCDVISNAIENEIPIHVELILDRDQFYVQPEVLLFPEDLPPPPEPVKEWKSESVFTIQQLKNLHRVLLDLAPNGTMPERMFTFLLQDMLVQDVEDGRESLAPELWRRLTSLELETLMNELFSKSEYVNWKDFIIYNLVIKMPTAEELLELRRIFRKKDIQLTENVPLEEFKRVKLWYEDEYRKKKNCDMERLNMMKELICDMYKVDKNMVNYSGMLLDFCKDHIGVVGFAKLLSLIVGGSVCWDANIGKAYVQHQLHLRKSHEENVKKRKVEIEDNKTIAEQIIIEAIDQTVHQCSSVVITELPNSPPHSPSNSLNLRDDDLESCADECICDDRCFCNEKKVEFSNVAIDFEASFDPTLVYFLELETILAVEAAVLHWKTQVQNINGKSFRQIVEEIYNDCKNPLFNNAVLAHEFLNHFKFSQLLGNTTRFTDKNPSNFLQNLITFRK